MIKTESIYKSNKKFQTERFGLERPSGLILRGGEAQGIKVSFQKLIDKSGDCFARANICH